MRACDRCGTTFPESQDECPSCSAATRVAATQPPSANRPPPPLPPRYQVVRFLGRGGMGQVFLCRDTKLDVEVAVKILPAEVAADAESLAQIEKEAKAAARFRDVPGILSLYGFEQYGDSWFLVMEFAGGGALADRLKKEGRLPEAECRRIGAEVAEALAAAHDQRVLHRDIKPANILLKPDGRVKVADFGIAKVLADTSAKMSAMTVTGTPVYMAPEIVLQGNVDHRADLYSLGCMLFELATGERPFKGSFAEISVTKLAPGAKPPEPREKWPELSEDFAAIVRRLLEVDPERRFPDARSCAAALRGEPARTPAVSPEGTATFVRPPPPSPPPAPTLPPAPAPAGSAPRPASRRWIPAVAAAAVLVLGGALYALGTGKGTGADSAGDAGTGGPRGGGGTVTSGDSNAPMRTDAGGTIREGGGAPLGGGVVKGDSAGGWPGGGPGLKLVTVAGAKRAVFSVYDAAGKKVLREECEMNSVIPIVPGTYTLVERYTQMPYAEGVRVEAGKVTTVSMGAIRGPRSIVWSLFDAAGETRLRELNDPGVVLTVAPGRYLIRPKDGNAVLGRLEVRAGEVAEAP